MVEGGEDVGEEEREVGGDRGREMKKKGKKKNLRQSCEKEKYGLEGIIGGEGEIEDMTL